MPVTQPASLYVYWPAVATLTSMVFVAKPTLPAASPTAATKLCVPGWTGTAGNQVQAVARSMQVILRGIFSPIFKTLFMPDAGRILQLIKNIPTVIITHGLDFNQIASIIKLLGRYFIVVFPSSHFLISEENELALFWYLSGEFVDQTRAGFRVVKSGVG